MRGALVADQGDFVRHVVAPDLRVVDPNLLVRRQPGGFDRFPVCVGVGYRLAQFELDRLAWRERFQNQGCAWCVLLDRASHLDSGFGIGAAGRWLRLDNGTNQKSSGTKQKSFRHGLSGSVSRAARAPLPAFLIHNPGFLVCFAHPCAHPPRALRPCRTASRWLHSKFNSSARSWLSGQIQSLAAASHSCSSSEMSKGGWLRAVIAGALIWV